MNNFNNNQQAIVHESNIANQQPRNEQQFMIDLVFKPIEPGLKLRPEETQLLLAYLGEILKEIEEEQLIVGEQNQVNTVNADNF